MPPNRTISAEEEVEFERGGGLKKRTMEDRAREGASFFEYFSSKSGGDTMEDILKTELGREKISWILSNYFLSMEVESGEAKEKLCLQDKVSHQVSHP